ncbi:MAG TPA: O-antigen ligase family protein [Chloroflexia bacterium]|nr:O-antigen ligase family protein [Chloroflexia bacterium]
MSVRATQLSPHSSVLSPVNVALMAGAGLGIAVGYGVPITYLLAGLIIPFSLLLTLARPHIAAMTYVVLVYTDLLSILVKYHGMPPLARFAGWAVFGAVLGYRLIVRREGLVTDSMTVWLAAYGGIIALGLAYARSSELVMSNVVEFTRIFLAYLIIINTITTTDRLRRTLWLLLSAGVFLASLTIFQSLIGTYENDFGGLAQFRVSEITGTNDAPRPGGTLGDANYYGQSLLILLPLALYLLAEGRSRLARLAGGFASLSLIIAIIFTYSRGDALALGIILVAAVLYKRPNPLYFLGGLVALLIAVPFLPSNYVSRLTTIADVASSNRQAILSEDSVRGRAGATYAAVEMFLDHPILGVGRENYPIYQLEYLAGTSFAKLPHGIPPHNFYLEVAAEHGLLGIVVVGGLLFMTWRALFEARRRFRDAGDKTHAELAAWLSIGLLGYLVSSLFLHGAHIWMLGLQIALIVALRQLSRVASPDFVSPDLPVLAPVLPIFAPRESATSTSQPTTKPESARPLFASGVRAVRSFIPSRRARPVDSPGADNRTSEGDEARRKLWLDAAERARLQGDSMTARALVDAVLARDPDNETAWQMDLRLRFSAPVAPTSPVDASTGTAQPTSAPASPASPSPAVPEPQTSAQPRATYKVAQPFRDEWRRLGGASVLGVPISPAFIEPTPAGRAIIVQYFTHARLERHPENKGTATEVTLARLGTEVPIEGVVASPLPEMLGGQQVSLVPGGISTPWKFSIFWHLKGGELVLGRPITPVLLWTASDGSSRAIQYFERARLEHHIDRVGTVDEVQLGDLGSEVFERRYGGKRYVN